MTFAATRLEHCLTAWNTHFAASDHVRVLGVTISSDLSLDKHVSNVCVKCFFLVSPI